MQRLQDYFTSYGVPGQGQADAGFHTSQRSPSENFAWKQPGFGLEEPQEEEGFWSLLGSQGDRPDQRAMGMNGFNSYKDVSDQADVGQLVTRLNAMTRDPSQNQRRPQYTGFENPYIQRLLSGGR